MNKRSLIVLSTLILVVGFSLNADETQQWCRPSEKRNYQGRAKKAPKKVRKHRVGQKKVRKHEQDRVQHQKHQKPVAHKQRKALVHKPKPAKKHVGFDMCAEQQLSAAQCPVNE